ncbi:hypothetical protein C8J56DRAFT_936242 [Mycena floridula]|nr:hypothetical protein C8J56DRAFT_970597 [Mycena floridula]KAJ7589787.1 hypothetical protein C8J56DRAFT_936242 [Mycena floridula]
MSTTSAASSTTTIAQASETQVQVPSTSSTTTSTSKEEQVASTEKPDAPTTSAEVATTSLTTTTEKPELTAIASPTTKAVPTKSFSSTPLVITVVKTTVISGTNGQAYTTVLETSSIVQAPSSTPASTGTDESSSSSSKTGTIVGGAIGGLLGLLSLTFIALFLFRWRKQRNLESEFDGDFDPGRMEKHSSRQALSVLLPEDENDGMGGRLNGTSVGGGVVTPFRLSDHGHEQWQWAYARPRAPLQMIHEKPQQKSYFDYPQSSGSSYNPYVETPPLLAPYPSSNPSFSGYPVSNPYPPLSPSFNYPPVSSPSIRSHRSGSSSTEIPSMKQIEAHRGLSVVNPDEGPSLQSSSRPEPSVHVHEDAGQLPSEIPPTYDSLLKR